MKLSNAGRGTYVSVRFNAETLSNLVELQNKLNLANATPREKMHTTICYSRVYVPYVPSYETVLASTNNHLEIWDTKYGKTLVLVLQSDYLKSRHELSMILGATYDFDEYKPHITLSYDIGETFIDLSKNPDINIVVDAEIVEDLDLDWK